MHDDVTKWKHFPRYWPFVCGIHRSPVNSPAKFPHVGGQYHSCCWWLGDTKNQVITNDTGKFHNAHCLLQAHNIPSCYKLGVGWCDILWQYPTITHYHDYRYKWTSGLAWCQSSHPSFQPAAIFLDQEHPSWNLHPIDTVWTIRLYCACGLPYFGYFPIFYHFNWRIYPGLLSG